ncbi:MAG: methyl-accepting chemotaxis protein, partial [Trinickia sp.]
RRAKGARYFNLFVVATVSRGGGGSTWVCRAGETLSDMVPNAVDVQSVVSGIARSTTEQTRGIQEVNRAVMQLDAMVQQNAALVEESAAASAALQTQASALASTIGSFKVG